MKTACILLASETNLLIFVETKVLKQQLHQNCKAYFKLLHLCKLVLDPCLLKWIHGPEILRCTFPKYSKHKTWTCYFCRTHKSFFWREWTWSFEHIYKVTSLFRYKTGVAVKITFLHFDVKGNTQQREIKLCPL